jgi:hypothetical protein
MVGALLRWVRGPQIVTRRSGPEAVAAVDGTDLGDVGAVVLALRPDAGDERMTRSGCRLGTGYAEWTLTFAAFEAQGTIIGASNFPN